MIKKTLCSVIGGLSLVTSVSAGEIPKDKIRNLSYSVDECVAYIGENFSDSFQSFSLPPLNSAVEVAKTDGYASLPLALSQAMGEGKLSDVDSCRKVYDIIYPN